MRRREFLGVLGGAAATWPVGARAQQPAMPVVGFLRSGTLTDMPHRVTAFRQGLKEAGFVEGQNVAIEYRADENQTERLPLLVADLLRRQVALIVGSSTPAALGAKAATTMVPIVFMTVGESLVSALSRRNLDRSSLGSCVSCGREPRALPCSSMPNGPLRKVSSQTCGLRLRPWGSKSRSSPRAASAKSRPPLQRSSPVGLGRCKRAAACSCCLNGNGLSRWRADTGFPRSIPYAIMSRPAV